MLEWFKNLFKKEINLDDYILKCPKCNSERIGYYTSLTNYTQVIQGNDDPEYKQTARCLDCGYTVESDVGDNSIGYLQSFVWEKRNV